MVKNFLLFVLLLLTGTAGAQTSLYVDSSMSASGSGTSWTTAYKTLNEALNVANAASTAVKYIINIARGTYYPTGIQAATNRDTSFLIIRGGISVLGGFPSGGGTRNAAANPTQLSGNIGVVADSTDNSYHVMIIAGITTTDTVALNGLTFARGCANTTITKTINLAYINGTFGGGLYTSKNSNRIFITDCIFFRNAANIYGGGMMSVAAPASASSSTSTTMLMMSNCTFQGNYAGQGGGLFNSPDGATYTIKSCSFSNNKANYGGGMHNEGNAAVLAPTYIFIDSCSFTANTSFGFGGGIENSIPTTSSGASASVSVTNCSFSANFASDYGGGMYTFISSVSTRLASASAVNCTFAGNYASYGGGIATSVQTTGIVTTATVTNCSFSGNTAYYYGGGMYNSTSSATAYVNVKGCSVLGNYAYNYGGGVYNVANGLTLDSCTITGNSTSLGGGIYNTTCSPAISRCRISGNSASVSGGGMYNLTSGPAIKNCLLSGNFSAGSGGAMYNYTGSSPTITNCTFSGDSAVGGRGLYNGSSTAAVSSPVITNSIIWEGANGVINANGSVPVITYSTVQGGYGGTGNLSANPLFVSPVIAASAPTPSGNYSLLPCSPAINAGITGSYAGITDLAGNPRLFNTIVDQGAYEYQAVYPAPITGNTAVCANATTQLGTTAAGGSWTSSNPALATVNATGLVTGISAGVDTIIYSTGPPCSNSTIKIIAINPLPTIAAISGNNSLCTGATTTLGNATTGGTWASSNNGIATISSAGLVTGISAGTDTISYTFTNTSGCTNVATKIVAIVAPPVVAAISGNSLVCAGGTTALSNTTSGGTWTSTNTSLATVSTGGTVTGVSAGQDTIVYTVVNSTGCSTAVKMPLTIDALPTVAAITGSNTVCINGGSTQLTNSTGGGTWTSSSTAIATVSPSGLVSSVALGTATISYAVTNVNGCTTTVTKVLTVVPTYNNSVNASICRGSHYTFGTQLLTDAGIYVHVFQSSANCDSTVTLTLAVDLVNTGVTQTGTQLTANESGATYQWINCASGKTPIAGQTAQSFTATANGQYAVIVTKNGCSDTSACKSVTGLGVAASFSSRTDIRVYPNPASGMITIDAGQMVPTQIIVRDITGRQLQRRIPAGGISKLDLAQYTPGLYLIDIYEGLKKYTSRVSVVH